MSNIHILVLNGPNLNLLGRRENNVYGVQSLSDIEEDLLEHAKNLPVGLCLSFFQSNHEGELIDRLHKTLEEDIDGVICNPGAYTHTSIALRDAFLAIEKPFVELHLSNVYARENFRHHSYFSDIAIGQIVGFGAYGYRLGLQAIVRYIEDTKYQQ